MAASGKLSKRQCFLEPSKCTIVRKPQLVFTFLKDSSDFCLCLTTDWDSLVLLFPLKNDLADEENRLPLSYQSTLT